MECLGMFMFLTCYLFILQGLTEYHFPVTWAPCIKTVIIIIIIIIVIIIIFIIFIVIIIIIIIFFFTVSFIPYFPLAECASQYMLQYQLIYVFWQKVMDSKSKRKKVKKCLKFILNVETRSNLNSVFLSPQSAILIAWFYLFLSEIFLVALVYWTYWAHFKSHVIDIMYSKGRFIKSDYFVPEILHKWISSSIDHTFPFTGEVWSREKPSPAKFSSDGGITAKITLPNFMGHARYVEQVLVLPFNKYTKSRILSKYQESFLRLVLNCV